MLFTGAALTLALALVTAQGPRSGANTKRKRAAPPTPTAAVEKRVAPPPRSESGQAGQPDKGGQAHRRGESSPSGGANGETGEGGPPSVEGQTTTRPAKTKVYTFGAMDVEGKLKTPQLLYFLNRVKLELEMSAPDHRSFMKELAKTADDPSL